MGTKNEKPEQNIQEMWDNYKRCNICAMGIPKDKRKRNRNETEAMMTENFSKLVSHIKLHIQEAQKTSRIN